MVDTSENIRPSGQPRARYLPWNSRRLTTTVIRRIARSMEIPASASTDDTCQMLEGKLLELGKEPLNVQVVVSEEGNIVLRDDEDIFHKVQDTDESREEGEERHPTSEGEQDAVDEEDSAMDLKEENEALKLQVEKLTDLLREEKEKCKEAWRLSCQQLAEYDDVLASKEEEIEVLKLRVKEVDSTESTERRSTYFSLPPTFEERRRPLDMMRASGATRKGKAPPVDFFTGEDPEVQFEDWLPTLERTAVWNGWTDEEALIQLAGHLRGRALIE